jgi:hypothetical protein
MDKSAILKGFNGQFEEFLDDVITLFPNNTDIKTTRTALLMLRKANPKMIISVWHRYVYLKYNDEIDNENIEYFLTKDYSEDLEKNPNASQVLCGIDKIRHPLRELNSENKNKCLQYLKNLNQLSQIYSI